jgi:hypothetical protein
MRRTLVCEAPEEGGVLSTAFVRPRLLALVMHQALRATVSGLLLESDGGTAKRLWRRPLAGDIDHVWRGHWIALNAASVVTAGERLLVSGATERLALDSRSGKVLAHSSAPASPSAMASVVGDALVAPEGQLVSSYDAVTMEPRSSRPTPSGTWAWAPAVEWWTVVTDEEDDAIGVWNVETGELRQLIVRDDLAVVATGSGAAERLAAVSLSGGALRWRAEFADPEPPRPQMEGRRKLPHPMCLFGSLVIAAVATPAVVALDLWCRSCQGVVTMNLMTGSRTGSRQPCDRAPRRVRSRAG